MTIPPARDLIQWRQPGDSPSAEWRVFAFSSYVDANPFPAFISTLVEICRVETFDDHVIGVPVNRLGECLSPSSVFGYLDSFPHSFDASQFCHGLRISGHLPEIGMGSETRLACAGGWLKRWLQWGGQSAAKYRATCDYTDSRFLCMREKVDFERRLSVMIARYVR